MPTFSSFPFHLVLVEKKTSKVAKKPTQFQTKKYLAKGFCGALRRIDHPDRFY